MVDEARDADVAHTISAVGWGAFFVWMGLVMLMEIPHGWALLVIGAITLAGQLARVGFGLAKEGFWLLVAGLFLLGGAWQLFNVQMQLVPVLLIGAGLAVILTRMWPPRRRHEPA